MDIRMKKQINFKGKHYDWDKFEDEVDIYDLTDEELEEYSYLLPKYSFDYSKPTTTWTGDMYIRSYEKYLDDERYENDEINEMRDFYKKTNRN